jgi:hypothetical protein
VIDERAQNNGGIIFTEQNAKFLENKLSHCRYVHHRSHCG